MKVVLVPIPVINKDQVYETESGGTDGNSQIIAIRSFKTTGEKHTAPEDAKRIAEMLGKLPKYTFILLADILSGMARKIQVSADSELKKKLCDDSISYRTLLNAAYAHVLNLNPECGLNKMADALGVDIRWSRTLIENALCHRLEKELGLEVSLNENDGWNGIAQKIGAEDSGPIIETIEALKIYRAIKADLPPNSTWYEVNKKYFSKATKP